MEKKGIKLMYMHDSYRYAIWGSYGSFGENDLLTQWPQI